MATEKSSLKNAAKRAFSSEVSFLTQQRTRCLKSTFGRVFGDFDELVMNKVSVNEKKTEKKVSAKFTANLVSTP